MTKVYELPNDHRMIADIDETTRTCIITETQLDSLISKLNYYAEGQNDVLDKIRAEIDKRKSTIDKAISEDELKIEGLKEAYTDCLEIINKYREESE